MNEIQMLVGRTVAVRNTTISDRRGRDDWRLFLLERDRRKRPTAPRFCCTRQRTQPPDSQAIAWRTDSAALDACITAPTWQ